MKVVISKTVSRTYSLWNYENYKPSITITQEFEDENITRHQYEERLNFIWSIIDDELKKEKQKISWSKKEEIDWPFFD